MRQLQNLTDKRFNKIKVLRYVESVKGRAKWECQCDCGTVFVAFGANLKNGHTKSCGCLRGGTPTHGLSYTRLFKLMNGMKNRCYNKERRDYKYYGGRGITICPEWLDDFQAFYDWAMENGYSDELTIDRIDNDLGYSPENCRWVSRKVQSRNKRNSVLITIDGITKTMGEWSKISGVKYTTLKYRHEHGWTGVKLLKGGDK